MNRTAWRAMARGAFSLGLFALITVGIVATTRVLTAERIADNRLASQYQLLGEVLPAPFQEIPITNLLDGAFTLPISPQLGQESAFDAWRVRHGDNAAVILPVIAPNGYNGAIHLLVGIDGQGRITGVRVTRHQETPGLGDKIERRKSDWITDFSGKSLGNPPAEQWKVARNGGEFDAFTGATITPRAVIGAVKRSLEYFTDHRSELLPSRPSAEKSS